MFIIDVYKRKEKNIRITYPQTNLTKKKSLIKIYQQIQIIYQLMSFKRLVLGIYHHICYKPILKFTSESMNN